MRYSPISRFCATVLRFQLQPMDLECKIAPNMDFNCFYTYLRLRGKRGVNLM